MKILLLILLSFRFPAFPEKQNPVLDSLEQALTQASDTSKVKLLSELCWQNRQLSQANAFAYGQEALNLAQKLRYNRGIAQAYNDLGILYFDQSNFQEAIRHYKLALKLRHKMKDQAGEAALYNKLGIVYQAQGQFKEALEYQLAALHIFEQLRSDYGIAQSLNNIGIIHFNLGNLNQALTYQKQSLQLKNKIDDKKGYAASLVNIANIYEKQKDLKKSISYHEKALKKLRTLNDKDYLAGVLNNLASVYQQEKNYSKALKCAREAYDLRVSSKNQKGMASALLNLGAINQNLNQPAIAEEQVLQAITIAKKINAVPELMEGHLLLAKIQADKNRYALAYQNQLKYSQLHDSVLNQNLTKEIAKLQNHYETRQKEAQLALLTRKHQVQQLQLAQNKQQLNQKQTQLFLALGALFCFGLFAYFIYNRQSLRQKLKSKRHTLHKDRLRAQAILDAEDKERKRIGSDLHDGLGQMISIAKLNLTGLQEEFCFTDETHKTLLCNTLTMLDEAYKEVRQVSHNLGISALQEQNISTALKQLLDNIGQSRQLEVQFETVGFTIEKLPPLVEKVIYRVVQESLNNILKHAFATTILVQLIRHEQELTLIIEDNGIGFDINNLPATSGIGLNNIRSRIEYLNGTLNIDSVLKRGTIITIEIPLAPLSTSLAEQTYETTAANYPLTVS